MKKPKKLQREDLIEIQMAYQKLGRYSEIFSLFKEKYGWKNYTNAYYHIKRAVEFDASEVRDKFKCENLQDFYWIGHLHSIKQNELLKSHFKLKVFNVDLNKWYKSISGENLYGNSICDSDIIDELNGILLKGRDDWLGELTNIQQKYFIFGYLKTFLENNDEFLVLPKWIIKHEIFENLIYKELNDKIELRKYSARELKSEHEVIRNSLKG